MVLEMSDVAAAMRRRTNAASGAVDVLGERAIFFTRALASTGRAVRSYRGETMRVIAEISLGTGVLAAIGGSIVILGFLTLFAGATVAVQGFDSLGSIGVDALTGFLAAYVNVRVVAPVTAGVGLAATIGAGTTAALGAMRISEEIDALEVMGIPSIPFLVTTRMIAAFLAVTIVDAGLILVLEDGRLVAQGTHQQLMESSASYREIAASQLVLEENL